MPNKIIQITAMGETEHTRSMLWALTEDGEIYFLLLRENKWMKQTLPSEDTPLQETNQ